MTSTNYTPGPWVVTHADPVTQPDVLLSVDATDNRGEVACGVFHAADAQLIAAAPDLLAALQMVCDCGVNLAEPIERAMLDAIAKAMQP